MSVGVEPTLEAPNAEFSPENFSAENDTLDQPVDGEASSPASAVAPADEILESIDAQNPEPASAPSVVVPPATSAAVDSTEQLEGSPVDSTLSTAPESESAKVESRTIDEVLPFAEDAAFLTVEATSLEGRRDDVAEEENSLLEGLETPSSSEESPTTPSLDLPPKEVAGAFEESVDDVQAEQETLHEPGPDEETVPPTEAAPRDISAELDSLLAEMRESAPPPEAVGAEEGGESPPGEPLKKELIEDLLNEPSDEAPGQDETGVGAPIPSSPLSKSETDLIAGLFTSPSAAPASEADAAGALTPAPGPKPKIDFAALRRARSTDVGQANVKVGRLFGGGGDEGSLFTPPPDATKPKAPPTPPVSKLAPPDPMKAIRAIGRLPAKLEEWSDQLHTLDAKLFYSIGMLGVLFGINGVAIVVLAFLGWI
jgi:hypothetical protein